MHYSQAKAENAFIENHKKLYLPIRLPTTSTTLSAVEDELTH